MAKKNNMFLLIVIIVAAFFLFRGGGFLGAITGSETVTRTGPSTVAPGEQFSVVYTANAGAPPWAVSIEDSSGNCVANDGNQFVISSDPLLANSCTSPCTRTFTAPSSGSCTIGGDYKFGIFNPGFFTTLSVVVEDTLDCTTLSNDAIGAITTWVNNPTTDNRNNALNSILAWAGVC